MKRGLLFFYSNLIPIVFTYEYQWNLRYQEDFTTYSGEVPTGFPGYLLNVPDLRETHQFDFIIVGSGSSGSVIANRLSENPTYKVLLLETGHPENSISQYPLFAPILQLTDYNWDYTMETQPGICLAMDNQRCGWPRGKALGGSTVINYMIYSRGSPQDYDKWAELGNPGWSYADVLPYFLKSERSRLESSNQAYHNQSGCLSVEDPFDSVLTKAFLDAGEELGYRVADYNGPVQFGFSKIQANIRKGRRHSVAKAFLEPVLGRRNLYVLTGARVTKILVNPSTMVAYGVEFTKHRRQFTVHAIKEVVISAGALNSPQLLMLSGIGPMEHLTQLGIPVLKDLPVGQTLYDHISYLGLVLNVNVTVEPASDVFNPVKLHQWYTTGMGPLASLGGFEGIAFVKTNVSTDTDDNYPDIELIMSGAGTLVTDYGLINRRTIKVSDEFYYRNYLPIEGTPSFGIIPMLLHPKSKGHMKLRSASPYDPPLFYGNFLTDPEDHDARTLIAGIRKILDVVQTRPMQKFGARLNPRPVIGCEGYTFNSDEYWRCALRYLTTTLHHQVATCKMGPKSDPTAVVDGEGRVHGVRSLRVADPSIIPIPVSGHTSAPAVMIGEKISDYIKKEWGCCDGLQF